MSEKSMPAGWSERCGNRSLTGMERGDVEGGLAQMGDVEKDRVLVTGAVAAKRWRFNPAS